VSAPSDTLYRYTAGVESGAFDRDLSADDRAEVVRLLRMALRVLDDFGGTPAADLARMMKDPQAIPAVNERVSDILFGCLTPGWTRTGLA
jgi:hypothetical protein